MKLQSRRQPVQTPPANLPDCRFVLTFRSKISFSSRRELKKTKFWYKRPSKIWHANRIGDLKKCSPNQGFWRSKWKCSPGGNPCKHVLPTSLTVAPRVTFFNIVVQKWASRRGESSKIEISIFKNLTWQGDLTNLRTETQKRTQERHQQSTIACFKLLGTTLVAWTLKKRRVFASFWVVILTPLT